MVKNLKKDEKRRGLLTCIEEEIQYNHVIFDHAVQEYIAIRVKGMNGDVPIVAIYRSINSGIENNRNMLSLLQERSDYNACHKLVVGDFNLPKIEWINFTCKLQEDNLSNNFIEKLRD